MKNKISLIAVVSVVLLATGCSSTKSAGEAQADLVKAKYKLEVEERKQELNSIPDWYLEPDVFDENGFYAVGMGKGRNMNLAIREAQLRAQILLAGNVSQLITAQEKLFSKADLENDGKTLQIALESFINEQDVAGTVFDKKEIDTVGTEYVYYTRAYLPVKLIQAAKDKAKFAADLNLASEDAQRELMLRVQKAKEQATQAAEAEAAKVQAEADNRASKIVERAGY